VAYADSLGLVTIIATNGSLLNEDRINFLHEHNVVPTISLDTLISEKYDRQCKGKLDTVLRNISLVKKKYREDIRYVNGVKIYSAGIHTIVNSENLDELDNLRQSCENDLFFSVGYIADHGEASKNPGLINDYELLKKEAEKQGEAFLLCKSKSGLPVCGYFYYGITIGCDGEILLADHALETTGLIGNIRTESLGSLREKASKLVDLFYEKGRCFCPVRDTYYSKFVKRCKNDK